MKDLNCDKCSTVNQRDCRSLQFKVDLVAAFFSSATMTVMIVKSRVPVNVDNTKSVEMISVS